MDQEKIGKFISTCRKQKTNSSGGCRKIRGVW
jgi:hypothetical protein